MQTNLRQYIALLHLPTTSGLLSLMVVGLIAVPLRHPERFVLVLAEGFLMAGVASNYLDELKGRPWRTRISSEVLWAIGLSCYALSTAIGLLLTLSVGIWFLLFVSLWGLLVPCYSLELFGGRFHNCWIIALNSALGTLATALLQAPLLNSSVMVITVVSGAIAFHGSQHYEIGKASGRNHSYDPFSRAFWRQLRLEVLLIDAIAIITLAARLYNI